MIYEVSSGLKHIHSMGYAHRDIKIENILFSDEGVFKICDFGSATKKFLRRISDAPKNLEDLIEEIAKNTTPMYRSPEQLEPQLFKDYPLAEKVDIFALGVLAYILCFKKPPFETSLGAVNGCCHWPEFSTVSEKLQTLIQSMLAVNPEHRPSAEGLCELIIS